MSYSASFARFLLLPPCVLFLQCTQPVTQADGDNARIKPVYVTQVVKHDTDDPAIWIHPTDPAQSLVLGTDKDEDGALYVFDLKGNIVEDKVVRGLARPNNVDVEYGLMINGEPTDIAVVTERFTHNLRIYRLPDMKPLDGGGIPVYEGETEENYRDLMGVSLYRRPATGEVYVIAGRKSGPTDGTYLWQYLLEGDSTNGQVKATLVRKFGNYSGKKEIEAIAVDDSLGYIYYSDEQVGVRKYFADPDSSGQELALFATEGYAEDNEGISIYAFPGGTGYILVSDQGADKFRIYPREGTSSSPHDHPEIAVIDVSTHESDGSETVALPMGPDFPRGLFVAMSTDRTFHYYRWEDIAGDSLRSISGPTAVLEE